MRGICGTVCQGLARCILPSVVLIKVRCRQPLRILASRREYTGSCASICFLVVWSVCVHYTNGIGDLCRGGLLLLLGCCIGVPVPQLVSFLFLLLKVLTYFCYMLKFCDFFNISIPYLSSVPIHGFRAGCHRLLILRYVLLCFLPSHSLNIFAHCCTLIPSLISIPYVLSVQGYCVCSRGLQRKLYSQH